MIALYIAAVLIFVLGLAHSVLGERFILARLFRRDNLPKLSRDDKIAGMLRSYRLPDPYETGPIEETKVAVLDTIMDDPHAK